MSDPGIYNKLLRWVRDVLPSVSLVATWVYNFMLGKIQKEKVDHIKTKLEKDKLENEKAVNEDNDGKSSHDTIMGAIDRGATYRRRNADASRQDRDQSNEDASDS